MRETRQKYDWQHTSFVLAMLFNINRGPKTSPKSPDDFNPFVKKAAGPKQGILIVPFQTLRHIYVPESMPR